MPHFQILLCQMDGIYFSENIIRVEILLHRRPDYFLEISGQIFQENIMNFPGKYYQDGKVLNSFVEILFQNPDCRVNIGEDNQLLEEII